MAHSTDSLPIGERQFVVQRPPHDPAGTPATHLLLPDDRPSIIRRSQLEPWDNSGYAFMLIPFKEEGDEVMLCDDLERPNRAWSGYVLVRDGRAAAYIIVVKKTQ
jgi:hypothetical protein